MQTLLVFWWLQNVTPVFMSRSLPGTGKGNVGKKRSWSVTTNRILYPSGNFSGTSPVNGLSHAGFALATHFSSAFTALDNTPPAARIPALVNSFLRVRSVSSVVRFFFITHIIIPVVSQFITYLFITVRGSVDVYQCLPGKNMCYKLICISN